MIFSLHPSPEIAYIRENVSLPALKHTVGNKAVERRKRTQVLQKAKLRPAGITGVTGVPP